MAYSAWTKIDDGACLVDLDVCEIEDTFDELYSAYGGVR